MARGIQVWSQTAASNANSDSGVNWAEGMAPSAVNDSARGEMASAAMFRDDNNGSLAGTLSTATYSVTSNQVAGALTAGYTIAIQIDTDMPATALLNLDTLGAKPLRPKAGTDFLGGEYKANAVLRAVYKTTNSGEWIVIGHRSLGLEANAVTTTNIINSAVTYAKIQNETNNTLLGNVSGGAAAPEEITIGTGLSVSGSTISAPAFPPPASFKALVIKVTGNTGATVAADYVTTTDGTNFQSTSVSSTLNLGTNGGIDALEGSLTIAQATLYYVWVIAKTDGTTKVLVNTSSSAVTFPSGYTFKARIGAFFTASGSAQLMGTWQLGRRAQYKVGLAQCTIVPVIASASGGAVGTFSTTSPTLATASVSGLVPATASRIFVNVASGTAGGGVGNVLVAPTTSYGGSNMGPKGSAGNSFPYYNGSIDASGSCEMVLEATTIAWCSSGTGGQISCSGWEDNL